MKRYKNTLYHTIYKDSDWGQMDHNNDQDMTEIYKNRNNFAHDRALDLYIKIPPPFVVDQMINKYELNEVYKTKFGFYMIVCHPYHNERHKYKKWIKWNRLHSPNVVSYITYVHGNYNKL